MKSQLEQRVGQLIKVGWTKSPTTESLIGPDGKDKVLLTDLARSHLYETRRTPPEEQEAWRLAQLEGR